MIDSIAAALGIKTIAGFIGGLLSLRFFDGLTFAGKLWTVSGGMAMAFFMTQPIMTYFEWRADKYEGGVGFIIGLFGMSIAAAGMKAITDIEFIKSLLKRP